MPAAMSYTPDDVALQKAAAAELLDRRTMIDEALRYYEGKHREYLKTDDGINDNVRRNLWKEAKDREVSFLFPKMVGLSLDQDELDDTSDEKWLLDAWEENGGAELLNELALWGALAGHVFARVMEPKPGEEYPCIYALDPSNVLVFWKADNKREVLWYSIYWASGKTEYRQDLVENERTEGWMIYQYSRERNDNTQTESTWGRTTATPWGYPSPPIVDWPHIRRPREYYGSNEGELIALNDALNRKSSDISRILRFHASPKTVGTGFEADEVVPTAIENFWTIDEADAKVYNLEMQSDLISSMRYVEFLEAGFRSEHRTVVLKGAAADFQRVTDMGVRTIFKDMLDKMAQLRLTYGRGITRLCKTLRYVGKQPNPEQKPKVAWPDPLPSNPTEKIAVIKDELDLGLVSKQTAATDMGRAWKVEQERIDAEGAVGDTPVMRQLRREQGVPVPPGGAQMPMMQPGMVPQQGGVNVPTQQ